MSYNLYGVLGIAREASDAAIRSAYRRRALETHPDKGGRADLFREVVAAFEILSDAERRSNYDVCLQKSGSDDGIDCSWTHNRGKRKVATVTTSVSSPTASEFEVGKPGSAKKYAKVPHSCHVPETDKASRPKAEAGKEAELLQELMSCTKEDCQRRIQDISFRALEVLLHLLTAGRSARHRQKENSGSVQQGIVADLGFENAAEEDSAASSSDAEDGGENLRETTLTLAICDHDDADADVPATTTASTRQRGIHHAHGRTAYVACLGWRSFMVITQSTKHLAAAIDWHILLVRFRQLATAKEAAGEDFEAAALSALATTLEERSEETGTAPPRLYFSSAVCVKGKIAAPNSVSLDRALDNRRKMLLLKAEGKDREALIAEKKRMSSDMKAERLETRRAVSAARLEGRAQHEQRRRAQRERLRWVIGFLRAQLRLLRRSLRWVSGGPKGLDASEMMDYDGVGRTIFTYAELNVCQGPLRHGTEEAQEDMRLLQRTLAEQGEAAAISEAERLDVELAAARFASML